MTASRPLTDWTDAWEDAPARVRRAPRSVPAREQRTGRGRPAPASRSRRTRPTSERARRLNHLRALRRDVLIDVIAAFVMMVMIFILTGGLGVVALLEIPLVAAIVASFVVEHRRRRGRRR